MTYLVHELVAAAPTSSESSGGSNALFTLLGAGITAVVSLAVVFIKFRFDRSIEDRKHSQSLQKARLELLETRKESYKREVRRVNGEFLAAVAVIYRVITTARRRRRSDHDDNSYKTRLMDIGPEEGQARLEEIRLLSDGEIVSAADALWHHVRSHPVVNGTELSSGAWDQWKEEYWACRSELIRQVRQVVIGP